MTNVSHSATGRIPDIRFRMENSQIYEKITYTLPVSCFELQAFLQTNEHIYYSDLTFRGQTSIQMTLYFRGKTSFTLTPH